MNGQHKSLGDFFTDRKTPSSLRANWPLVVEAGNRRVLWVCGLQPGNDARITDSTQQVLHLRWEREAIREQQNAGTKLVQEQAMQPKRKKMSVNVKPLTHWIIYKSYSVRFSSRTPRLVTGVLTTPDGPLNFSYEPEEMVIQVQSSVNEPEQEERIKINEHGWEIEQK